MRYVKANCSYINGLNIVHVLTVVSLKVKQEYVTDELG